MSTKVAQPLTKLLSSLSRLVILLGAFVGNHAHADVLYGMTYFGIVGQIDIANSTWTPVVVAPFSGAQNKTYSFAVYKNTFVSQWELNSTQMAENNFLAFGRTSQDFCVIGPVSPRYDANAAFNAGYWALRPISNSLLTWRLNAAQTAESLSQYDLQNRTLLPVANSTNNLSSSCWQSPSSPAVLDGPVGITFTDQNTMYGIGTCLTAPVNDPNRHDYSRLYRWVYANGAWTANLNIPILVNGAPANIFTGHAPGYGRTIVQDPGNPGTFYLSGSMQPPLGDGNAYISKIVFNGTSATWSGPVATLTGVPGIASLAYGPVSTQIVSPKSVAGLSCADPGWLPLNMLMQ